MTISQALRRVKFLKGRMAELSKRAAESVSYPAEHKPPLEFSASHDELAKVRKELVKLETALTCANTKATVEWDGQAIVLAEAVRWLQEYKAEVAWLQGLQLKAGTFRTPTREWDEESGHHVFGKVEATFVSDLSEVDRVRQVDELRDRFARLNDVVETANHHVMVD